MYTHRLRARLGGKKYNLAAVGSEQSIEYDTDYCSIITLPREESSHRILAAT